MLTTTNYGLKKPEGTDVVDIQNFNDNADIIDQALKKHDSSLSDMMYQVAGGTGTAITLTINGTLKTGYPITFIVSANNGGAATTINGKKLFKPATTTAPNLIVGKAYTVWYNSTGDSGNGCFFIKASAEGTALAKDVRKNTTFSNDIDTGLPGGLDLSLLVSGNLRAGVTIDGVTGATNVVDTTISSSVATAAMIRAGYKCFINGVLTTGTATEKATATITPTTSDQTIPSGVITTGAQTIKGDASLVAANIVSGISIFGVAGAATVASLGGMKIASGTISSTTGAFSIPAQSFTIKFWIAYYLTAADGSTYTSVGVGLADANRTFYATGSSSNNTVCGAYSTTGQLKYLGNNTIYWVAFGV